NAGSRLRLARRAVALLAALLFTLTVSALAPPIAFAQQPQPKLSVTQVDASGYPQITAFVTALDANGVPARSLTAQQFQAFDGSTTLTVSNVQTVQNASVPLSVAITIDISGSMDGEPHARAKDAATAFVR